MNPSKHRWPVGLVSHKPKIFIVFKENQLFGMGQISAPVFGHFFEKC
jgi:hypothetical protein